MKGVLYAVEIVVTAKILSRGIFALVFRRSWFMGAINSFMVSRLRGNDNGGCNDNMERKKLFHENHFLCLSGGAGGEAVEVYSSGNYFTK